jgi:hypothetical protein
MQVDGSNNRKKNAYPRSGEVTRMLRTLRDNGFNPSDVLINREGEIRFSVTSHAGSKPSDFDVWNAAGKL